MAETEKRDFKIEFIASLPPIQSAIQLDGLEGARIKLDVPENNMMAVLKLTVLKGKTFKVTISEPQDN